MTVVNTSDAGYYSPKEPSGAHATPGCPAYRVLAATLHHDGLLPLVGALGHWVGNQPGMASALFWQYASSPARRDLHAAVHGQGGVGSAVEVV